MQLTLLHGYPDRVGRRAIFVGFGHGPTSYVGGNSPTDLVIVPVFQFYIDAIPPAVSSDGFYEVRFQPAGYGPRIAWHARYFSQGSGEAANGTDLSASIFQISGYGGFY